MIILHQKQVRTTFFTSTLTISLALFFFGLFALFALAGKVVVEQAQEQLDYKIMLVDNASEQSLAQLKSALVKNKAIRSITYRSKTDAFNDFQSVGEDFKEVMEGFNPFLASLNLRFEASFVTPDSIQRLTTAVLQFPIVQEVDYPIHLIEQVQNRTGKLVQLAVLMAIVLVIITFLLILNTVRLSIYSKRLIIRTMQLVGATDKTILAPFITIGITQGILGGIIAILLLITLIQIVSYYFIPINFLLTNFGFVILCSFILILGVSLGWGGSRVAVKRYLNKSLDEIA
ncbi:MAG: permease-like cell division protein FtsX [Bacteroidia bacterium]|nr:permease-like cell division protein FtsX [Bacteroidia bacterium]